MPVFTCAGSAESGAAQARQAEHAELSSLNIKLKFNIYSKDLPNRTKDTTKRLHGSCLLHDK